MNTSIKTILAAIAMGATAIAAQAQTGQSATPKAVTIDLVKTLTSYYRTADENNKLQTYEQSMNTQAQDIITQGRAMAEKFKAAQDQINSPVATDIAKQQAQAQAQSLAQDMQKKQAEFDDFRQKAVQNIQQTAMQVRQQLLKEIVDKATTIGKAKGATMILDRGSLVYADTGMDITDEVIAALNQGHPMPVATGTAATPTPAVGYPGN